MLQLPRRAMLASLIATVAGPALAQTPQPAPLTIVIHEAGPHWQQGRPMSEQDLAPHLGYVAGLFQAGPVVAYGTEAGDVVRGYYILAGGDPSVARGFIDNDPGVRSGVLKPAGRHVVAAVVNALPGDAGGMAFTILRMQPGPKWAAGKPMAGQDIQAHFAFMVGQAKAGIVVLAAPDMSGQEGWYILRGDAGVAAKLLADDPGARSGVLRPMVLGWNVIAMRPAN